MPHFTWDSVILHNRDTVEITVHGETEADPSASDAEQAKGLLGSVSVYIRNLSEFDEHARPVKTYEELRYILRSAKAFREFSNYAMESFDNVCPQSIRLAAAHKAINEDVHPLVCALYQISKMRNKNNHRVSLSGSTDERFHKAQLNGGDLSEVSDSPSPPAVPTPPRSISPEATVPSALPSLEELVNNTASKIDAIAKKAA